MNSCPCRPIPLAILALFCCSNSFLFSQARPASSSIQSPMQNPTLPEVQPRLDIDRDPVPSPDPDVVPPVLPNTSANAPSTPGQPSDLQKGQNGMYVLHANVDEVILSCTVIDDKGRTVDDLKQGDFRVWEDGVPQTVNSVQRQDVPVSMGILVDNSGSMRDKRAAVNAAAYHLLKASNPRDEAFVVNFSDRAYLDQGFTTDLVALNRSLTRADSAGTTALYDTVAAAADELSRHAKLRKEVLLIVTDGADNASHIALNEAIRRVQDLGGPVVYSIGLLFDTEAHESERAKTDLEALSRETGGVAYFPRSLQEVDTIVAEVARDIRDQYSIDYHASRPGTLGGYRVVHVEAKAPNHGTLVVRTKRGYYAEPPKQTHTSADARQ
jgi:Ca-activated chloride channel family protein